MTAGDDTMAIPPPAPKKTTVAKKAAAKKTAAKKTATKKTQAPKTHAKKAGVKTAQAKKTGPKKSTPKAVTGASAKTSKPDTAPPSTRIDPPKKPRKPEAPASSQMAASLEHFPILLFGAGLGLAGFAAAWREVAAVYGTGGWIAILATGIAVGVFMILVVLYAMKATRYPATIMKDFKHPVASNFLAVPTITLILLSSNLIEELPTLALILWALGSITNIAITVLILNEWIHRDCTIDHAAPVWFIPIVGNLIIPTMAASLGYPSIGWMVLGFAVLFWIALFTVVFYRMLFSHPLSAALKPSVAIFLAPPSLTFINYLFLSGGTLDGIATMLMGACLFTLLFLLPQIPDLMRQPFSLSWWSYIFPLAAFAIACILYADASGSGIMHILAQCVMVLLSILTLIIATKTVLLVARGTLFRPSVEQTADPPRPAASS